MGSYTGNSHLRRKERYKVVAIENVAYKRHAIPIHNFQNRLLLVILQMFEIRQDYGKKIIRKSKQFSAPNFYNYAMMDSGRDPREGLFSIFIGLIVSWLLAMIQKSVTFHVHVFPSTARIWEFVVVRGCTIYALH